MVDITMQNLHVSFGREEPAHKNIFCCLDIFCCVQIFSRPGPRDEHDDGEHGDVGEDPAEAREPGVVVHHVAETAAE